MRVLILVAGMHRSGTSAFTGALTLAGAAPPTDLMPANFANERGYFESWRFTLLHDEILKSAATSWRDWRPFSPDWRFGPAAASFRARAIELIHDQYGSAPLIAIKDPRICRFIPFWIDTARQGGFSPRIVIPFRAPHEVAQSLAARDGMAPVDGLMLWLRHILDAERDSRGLVRAFATMEGLLADWRGALDRVGRQIDVSWSNSNSAEINALLDPSLRHHNVRADGAAGVWATEVHDALAEFVDSPQSQSGASRLDAVAAGFERACRLFDPSVGASAPLPELNSPDFCREPLRRQTAQLRDRLEKLRVEIAAASAQEASPP